MERASILKRATRSRARTFRKSLAGKRRGSEVLLNLPKKDCLSRNSKRTLSSKRWKAQGEPDPRRRVLRITVHTHLPDGKVRAQIDLFGRGLMKKNASPPGRFRYYVRVNVSFRLQEAEHGNDNDQVQGMTCNHA